MYYNNNAFATPARRSRNSIAGNLATPNPAGVSIASLQSALNACYADAQDTINKTERFLACIEAMADGVMLKIEAGTQAVDEAEMAFVADTLRPFFLEAPQVTKPGYIYYTEKLQSVAATDGSIYHLTYGVRRESEDYSFEAYILLYKVVSATSKELEMRISFAAPNALLSEMQYIPLLTSGSTEALSVIASSFTANISMCNLIRRISLRSIAAGSVSADEVRDAISDIADDLTLQQITDLKELVATWDLSSRLGTLNSLRQLYAFVGKAKNTQEDDPTVEWLVENTAIIDFSLSVVEGLQLAVSLVGSILAAVGNFIGFAIQGVFSAVSSIFQAIKDATSTTLNSEATDCCYAGSIKSERAVTPPTDIQPEDIAAITGELDSPCYRWFRAVEADGGVYPCVVRDEIIPRLFGTSAITTDQLFGPSSVQNFWNAHGVSITWVDQAKQYLFRIHPDTSVYSERNLLSSLKAAGRLVDFDVSNTVKDDTPLSDPLAGPLASRFAASLSFALCKALSVKNIGKLSEVNIPLTKEQGDALMPLFTDLAMTHWSWEKLEKAISAAQDALQASPTTSFDQELIIKQLYATDSISVDGAESYAVITDLYSSDDGMFMVYPSKVDKSSFIKACFVIGTIAAVATIGAVAGKMAISRFSQRAKLRRTAAYSTALNAYTADPSRENLESLRIANRKATVFGAYLPGKSASGTLFAGTKQSGAVQSATWSQALLDRILGGGDATPAVGADLSTIVNLIAPQDD